MYRIRTAFVFILTLLCNHLVFSQIRVLDKEMHHLRSVDEREWTYFPMKAERQLTLEFNVTSNHTEQTLRFRQEDVRQNWVVQLNEKELGKLQSDEGSFVGYFPIAAQLLKVGKNTLTVTQKSSVPDDIRVGDFALVDGSLKNLLSEAQMTVTVADKTGNSLIPSRITIVNEDHALQPVAVVSNEYVAVRDGSIYTANGNASFTLPGGKYRVYASRGFEYSVDSFSVVLKSGDRLQKKLTISREVPTVGWINADTHIHTYSFSGHGDATVRERVLTIAGEGIELPISTDHNVLVDIDSMAKAMKVRSYFTPVVGNEYTTPVGHFNVFPVAKASKLPDYKVKDWAEINNNLNSDKKGRVVILNHARDIHNNFRPFDPGRHVAVAGMDLEGETFPANAMEVLNSSSQQNDFMRLFLDWFGMLNRGHNLTPVGSSDSHDVSRYLVGQGRTYIKYSGDQPGNIDVNEATKSFLAGKVMVSFGLLAEITVNKIYGPGDLVPSAPQVQVSVRVLGPGWLKADRVSLFANGQLIKVATIKGNGSNGVKWSGSWTIPMTKQDMFFVAIAEGPETPIPFWQIPKPYQRTSAEWKPRVVGSSGAVWVDADGDGKKTSAYDYANKLISNSQRDMQDLLKGLSAYDEAVSVQAAALLQRQGVLKPGNEISELLKQASPAVQKGFKAFNDAWQETEVSMRAK